MSGSFNREERRGKERLPQISSTSGRRASHPLAHLSRHRRSRHLPSGHDTPFAWSPHASSPAARRSGSGRSSRRDGSGAGGGRGSEGWEGGALPAAEEHDCALDLCHAYFGAVLASHERLAAHLNHVACQRRYLAPPTTTAPPTPPPVQHLVNVVYMPCLACKQRMRGIVRARAAQKMNE